MARKRHRESPARRAARLKRDAVLRQKRAELRKRREVVRRRLREEARKRRDAIRKALREQERERRDALRRLARELAREKRDAERALLRRERRLLLRQKYVVRMMLNANGQWSWYRMSGPSYSQVSRAVRGQIAQYPRVGVRRLKAQKPSPWL